MSGRGQIHTLEAIIAAGVILTALFTAMAIPSVKSGLSDFEALQLKKHADDVLTLLTMENESGESILTNCIRNGWSGFDDLFNNTVVNPLMENLSICVRLEVYNMSDKLVHSAGCKPIRIGDVSSSFCVLLVNKSIYEVRIYVWRI